jgi:hypothetical protein
MRSFADPASMTPDERLSEVASIFAAGLLRLHARAALSCDHPALRNLRIPLLPALSFRAKPCSVSIVVNGSRDPKTRRKAWN